MDKEKLILARIDTLEIERNKIASERDRLILEQKFVLDTYTGWLISNDYIITMGKNKIDYVGRFRKSLNKLKSKLN